MALQSAKTYTEEDVGPEGLAELFSSGVLDSPTSGAFQRIAWLASKVLNAPIAYVSLLGGRKYWLYSSEICNEAKLIRGLNPVAAENRTNDVFEIPDSWVDPDYFDLPACEDEVEGIRFYASAPFAGPSGEVCGKLVLASRKPRRLTMEERNVFRCLADQVESELRLLLLMQEEASLRFAATKAFNAKSAFLSLISHEIRTPIAGIMGATDMLQAKLSKSSERDQPAETELLDTVWSSASDLLHLLNDTLEAAKIEADGVQINVQSFDLVLFCDKLRRHFKPVAENKNLVLSIGYGGLDTFSQNILADPTRIRQILFNLIHNAMKFTSEGHINCRLEVEDREGGELDCFFKITVSDTGPGMSPEVVEDLFVPFNQTYLGDDREYGGTGLGMSLVKQLVDRMNGAINVTSAIGEGTTIEIKIPTKEVVEDEWVVDVRPETEPARIGRLENVDSGPLVGLQVLVADDNSQNRFILSRVLESWGCDPVLAECGNSALDLAKQHSFDAIILDLHMPRKSGFEVAKSIRQLTSSTRLIACSADTTQAAYAKCQEAGFDDILAKPFDWTLMHNALLRCV
ncbi:ATP-binding protein [Hirschia litorea]|uniref:histidine kinase n=1 Tax=Hirschia litorea TaxID=1199156 RepID=A0ABW2IJK7_9PROT